MNARADPSRTGILPSPLDLSFKVSNSSSINPSCLHHIPCVFWAVVTDITYTSHSQHSVLVNMHKLTSVRHSHKSFSSKNKNLFHDQRRHHHPVSQPAGECDQTQRSLETQPQMPQGREPSGSCASALQTGSRSLLTDGPAWELSSMQEGEHRKCLEERGKPPLCIRKMRHTLLVMKYMQVIKLLLSYFAIFLGILRGCGLMVR